MWILPKQLHTSAFALGTEALISDLSEQSQISAQSLLVRSKPLPVRIWSRKWKRDSWTQHLSGRILRPSLGDHFVTAWTSSLAATLASHSPQPGSDSARTILDTSGLTSQTEFGFSSQPCVSLRTSRDTLPSGCVTFSTTWDEWVTERRGAYSRRRKLALPTSGKGYSSWPTAAARDFRDTGDLSTSDYRKDGKLRKDVLPRAVSLDQRGYYGLVAPVSTNSDGNRPASWATPRANKTEGYSSPEFRPTLHQQAQSWATPRTGMARGNDFSYDRGRGNIEEQAGASVMGGGKLNPRWVETLMGLPVGWTMPGCASPVTIGQMS